MEIGQSVGETSFIAEALVIEGVAEDFPVVEFNEGFEIVFVGDDGPEFLELDLEGIDGPEDLRSILGDDFSPHSGVA